MIRTMKITAPNNAPLMSGFDKASSGLKLGVGMFSSTVAETKQIAFNNCYHQFCLI